MTTYDPERGPEDAAPRRGFISLLFKVFLFVCFAAPLASFLRFRVKHPPRLLTVARKLKKGGFILAPEFIIFDTASGPRAISRKCTHLGCRLNFHEESGQLVCPCHHSRFDRNGHRLAGPARRDLAVYPVRSQAGGNGFVVSM